MGLHVLAKRGSTLGFGGILGIVAGGLAILNLTLLIVWCIIRRRTKKMKQEQQQRRASASSTDADLESIFSKSSMASIPNASYLQVLRTLHAANAPRPRLVTVPQANASRRPAPSSPNTPSSPTIPRSAKAKTKTKRRSHTCIEPKSAGDPHRTNKLYRTKPHKPQQRPHTSAPAPMPQSSPSPSPTLRRANSFDSASIYSAASAPRELHTQPFALDPAPAKYTWAPRPHDPPGVVFLVTPPPVLRDMSPIAEASEESSLISAESAATVMLSPPASPEPVHLRASDGSGGGGRREPDGVPVSSPPGMISFASLPPPRPLRIRPRATSIC